jgi:DUF971 family protein
MTPDATIPVKLNLKKTEQLEIEWRDGRRSTYPIVYLRSMCPCATCKGARLGYDGHPPAIGGPPPAELRPKRTSLTVLPGNYSQPLSALSAELVGNYALRIDWSDEHGSGIYSFDYLREISPE